MKVDPNILRQSKFSKRIYDCLVDDAFLNSIKTNSVLEPIVVDRNNVIISGHRRVEACKKLGIKEIPFVHGEHTELAVIEHNRCREKTWQEKLREADALERLLRPKAKQQQGKRTDLSPTLAKGLKPVDVREEVAADIGVSHGTLTKAKFIATKNLEALKKVDAGRSTINAEFKKLIQEENRAKATTPPLPEGKFNVILADPPWRYDHDETPDRRIENHYATMGLDGIQDMKIPASDDAILFLWCPAPLLKKGLQVMESWGFEYKTNAVWDKMVIGMGYWLRQQHEVLLIGVKGKFRPPAPEARVSSIIRSRRQKHSKKPEVVYEIIEKMYPDRKYLELFARNARTGWTAWGNEVCGGCDSKSGDAGVRPENGADGLTEGECPQGNTEGQGGVPSALREP